MIALLLAGAIPAAVENLTVYRITPQNYTGVLNMNTGDAAGDAFFGLYELAIPVLCADSRMDKMITCANVPILSIPGFNLYQQFVLEVDTRFGEYNECNPNPNSGIFACEAGHGHSSHSRPAPCWYTNPAWASEFDGVCDKGNCTCEVITSQAVGRELIATTMGGAGGGGAPVSPKCMAAATASCGSKKGKQQLCELCFQFHAKQWVADGDCTEKELQQVAFGLVSHGAPDSFLTILCTG